MSKSNETTAVGAKLSVLFWLKKSRATTDGAATVYVGITINGLAGEIPTGVKVPVDKDNRAPVYNITI